jgi:hypothetical protein
MSTALPEKVAQMLRLALSTDRDGEALAALAAIRRVIDLHRLADAVQSGLGQQPAPTAARKPAEPKTTRRPRHKARKQPEPPFDPADWLSCCWYAWHRRDLMSDRDLAFVNNLLERRREPTPRQMKWLRDIMVRVRRPG